MRCFLTQYCDAGSCITATAEKWLDEFFVHCKGCRVDFITAHIYTCNVDAIRSYVQSLSLRYNRPVWLTEFNCPNYKGSLERQINFMQKALKVWTQVFVHRPLKACAFVLLRAEAQVPSFVTGEECY